MKESGFKVKKMAGESIIMRLMIRYFMMEIGKETKNKVKVIFSQNKVLMMGFG